MSGSGGWPEVAEDTHMVVNVTSGNTAKAILLLKAAGDSVSVSAG